MNSNKLYLFAKNTDAFASQRGYNYQTLKTLETWLENYQNNIKEDIYCEFEEDIFQKDLIAQKLKFRQIKLYSSDFSFSSEEIKKAISHFFMLHVKSDYCDFGREYVFETNSSIKRKHKNNDADLLKEWFKNQDKLNEEKLAKYAAKVKNIVTEYIGEEEKNIKDEAALKEAIAVFDNLDQAFWIEFAKMIKWEFGAVSPESEFDATKTKIEVMIADLPHPNAAENPNQTFGLLLDAVFDVVNEKQGEERKLTYEQLDKLLLSQGSDDDKWYAEKFDYYKTIEATEEFRLGEFYDVIDLGNYCRRKKYLHSHKDVWNPLLTTYARDKDLPPVFRRKAIYELTFLNNEFYEVDYENLDIRMRPTGSLIGYEDDLCYYFSDFSAFKTAKDIEQGYNLINIVLGAITNKKSLITIEELRKWFVELYRKIHQQLLTTDDVNETCNLLEQKGNFLMGINRVREKNKTEFKKYFDEILTIVDEAPLFKLSQFGDRIEKYIKMQLNIDPEDKMGIIAALEDFSGNLFPLVLKREGKITLAHTMVKRGYNYLNTTIPANLLKALDYFHKAKDNYFQEDTMDGFVLALLNIAQLYNAIGMHFAAKNYALAAFRVSSNKELFKRVEASLALLAYSDYKQGSWFNALSLYLIYFKIKSKSNLYNPTAELEHKALLHVAVMIYVMTKSSNQFEYLTKAYINQFGEKVEFIEHYIKTLEDELNLEEKYTQFIENKIDDFPLNDFSKKRMVSFYALGSLWRICFENTHEVRSVAEEYISAIQVVLGEIALSETDFHLLKSEIEIELVLGKDFIVPEQLPSNDIIKWKVSICHTDVTVPEEINKHGADSTVSLVLILNNISVLKNEEFMELYLDFFTKSKLDSKHIAVNLYQKMHRDVYHKEDYDVYQPLAFEKDIIKLNLPKENNVMVWNSSLSAKYSKKESLKAILHRFQNLQRPTHLTVEKLKQDAHFVKWLNDLRGQGYKDWQILTNMMNFMINYKMREFENITGNTEEELQMNYKKSFNKYVNMDEKDCYIEFPLKAFQTKEFMSQFNISLPSMLHTYGLEVKLVTPNFKAMKEFLDIRFNLINDDYNDINPFNDL